MWCIVKYKLYKIYPDRTGKGSIIDGIRNIAPVVRKPPLDVVIHSPTWPKHPVLSPPERVVEGVRVRLFGSHNGDITVLVSIKFDVTVEIINRMYAEECQTAGHYQNSDLGTYICLGTLGMTWFLRPTSITLAAWQPWRGELPFARRLGPSSHFNK